MVLVKPVPDTDEHRIAFITLHGFQILDKEVLPVLRTHQGLNVRVVAQQKFNLVTDCFLLTGREGGDTKRLVREPAVILNDRRGHGLRLAAVDPCLPALVHGIGQVDEGETKVGRLVHGRREDHEVAVIELLIGYGDQGFMPRAVVPAQTFCFVGLLADVEQAFHVGDACDRLSLILFIGGCDLVEEGGRRKLA